MVTCPACGSENREGARFCDSCASPLAPAEPARESRKTVTVVFCDVTGSTALGERLDPESLRQVMSKYFEAMRVVLERHGGTVQKFMGDAVMAVFGIPHIHEDDALRAVRAAVEMRTALTDLNGELEGSWGVSIATRIGVNTGETIVGRSSPGGSLVIADAANVAARLEQAAAPGEILIGASTYRLVRDAVRADPMEPLTLKGKSQPMPAYRLIDMEPEGGPDHRADSPLVGRTRELRLLGDAYEHAANDRACQLVTVLGVAGVGKSRLVAEALAASPPDASVLTGRCLPYGEGITFWPVAEVVKQASGITEADSAEQARSKVASLVDAEQDGGSIAQRVCELIGLDPPGASLEQGFWATRKFLEVLAHDHPLVVTFDDLQWAESALLDLIEHIADWSRDAPIVLLCMARPEFLEVRPGWGGGKMNAVALLLQPLSAIESETLVANLLPGAELPAPLRSRVLEAAGGNPLFLEETFASLIEEGRLVNEDGVWRQVDAAGALDVPPTIQALLAARLDRLGKEELAVIEGAAVVGQVFYRDAVSELAPEGLRPDVGTYLLSLVRKDLVRPDRSTFAGGEAFRFRHLLIRDAAYQAMPKQTRAELHERFARWLERTAGERRAEYEEIIGYHLEQAFRYREQLGPVDELVQGLAAEAGRALGQAGVRAGERADYAAGASLLERAISLLPGGPEEVDWLMRLARARHILGNPTLSGRTLDGALARAEAVGDPITMWRARLARLRFQIFVDPHWSPDDARALANQAIAELEALGDDYGLALAWRLLGDAEGFTGQYAAWGRACERVTEYGRRVGDWNLQMVGVADLSTSLVYGPTPVPLALERCRKIVSAKEGGDEYRFWTVRHTAELEAMLGHFDTARKLLAEAKDGHTRLGLPRLLVSQGEFEGRVELLAGRPRLAEEGFRSSLAGYAQSGEPSADVAILTALLGEAIYQQGRDDEALECTEQSAGLAPGTDPISNSMWRAVRAKVLARRGELGKAEAMAREAVKLSTPTDHLQVKGDVLLDLAEILTMAGRVEESLQRTQEALDLYERKGITVLAERARSLLREREGGDHDPPQVDVDPTSE